MNSWKSTLLSACAPPLRMFIIGTGSTYWPSAGARPLSVREVRVERPACRGGRGARDGHRDAEQRVGAEAALGRRAVERDQRASIAR